MAERVVIDTSVWSLVLRRHPRDLSPQQRATARLVRDLIVDGRAVLLGVVRQELLSGVSEPTAFEGLRSHSAAFDDEPPDVDDYERAGAFANACRAAGVADPAIDLLICAFASGRDLPVLSSDADFARYAAHLPVRLHPLP